MIKHFDKVDETFKKTVKINSDLRLQDVGFGLNYLWFAQLAFSQWSGIFLRKSV